MSEGIRSWQDYAGHIWLLNLRSPDSTPVDSGLKGPGEVDDHLIAGLDDQGHVQVQALPFGQATSYQPRLIGTIAADSFTPGSGDWTPQFDTSKPLKHVQLTISHDGTVVRTLTGSAKTGSIRNLSWDGGTTAGTAAPAGDYTWRLTATARDGDGPLTDINGHSTITGTLTLTP
jgi:hypothetical protein